MIVVKSSNALHMNWRGTGRPMKGLRNVHNTVIRRTHRPSPRAAAAWPASAADPEGL
jgi:hypothetical protein